MRIPSVITTMQALAEKEVEAASQRLAALNNMVANEQRKLDMLAGYKQDYKEKLAKKMESGMDSQTYDNYQNFLEVLEKAIQGQRGTLQQAEARAQLGMESWQLAQRKKLTYGVLHNRATQRISALERKMDQKLSDEFAANAIRRLQYQ